VKGLPAVGLPPRPLEPAEESANALCDLGALGGASTVVVHGSILYFPGVAATCLHILLLQNAREIKPKIVRAHALHISSRRLLPGWPRLAMLRPQMFGIRAGS
jgi:hypothetical protein